MPGNTAKMVKRIDFQNVGWEVGRKWRENYWYLLHFKDY